MAKAKQLPSGNWNVLANATINGQYVRKSFTAPTAKKAEQAAEQWQQHIKMIGSDFTRMTVKEAMLFYIESNENKLSPSTVKEYARIAQNDMQDIIDKPLYMLNVPIIDKSINTSLKTLSPKTIKNRYGFLQRILAVYYPEFVWAVTYPPQVKKQKKMYSNEYISKMLKAIKGSDFELEIYLGLLSMRESEICALKWSDISLTEKRLNVCRKKVQNKNLQYIIVENNKTYHSARDIYLPDYVCKLIQERKEKSHSEFVTDVSPHSFWDRFQYILKTNSLEPISFHSLRHIYSSVSSSLGIDAEIRMANGGWSSERVMDGNYRHRITESQLEANKKMNDYFNQVAGNSQTISQTRFRKRLKLARFGNF